MALLVETTINGQHAAYTFQVHWNEDAFVEGHVAFEVHAIRTSKEGEPRTVKAVVMLENKDPQSPDLVIIIAGEVVFRDSLSNLTGENLVLDSIPGAAFAFGDPILGCFIRAGISAAVSQILHAETIRPARVGERAALWLLGAVFGRMACALALMPCGAPAGA